MTYDDFYSFPRYETCEALRDGRVWSKEPFSRIVTDVPAKGLLEHAKTLHNHILHGTDESGITREEIAAVASIERKLEKLHEEHVKRGRDQDLVLRCLHPDGCYFGWFDTKAILRAYEIMDADPVRGVGDLLRKRSDKLPDLVAYLEKQVEGIRRKRRTW